MQAGLFPVLLAAFLAFPAAAAEKKVAVFEFELIDSSLEGEMLGPNEAEQARLKTMAPALREDIEAEPDLAVVDTSSVQGKADGQYLDSCGNCAVSFASEVGADIVVTGTVQKVSNLILNINAYAFDVATGEAVARGSADIRSNTDESWRRGLQYLWENVLKEQLGAAN